ncbi:hypothetical protein KGA66_12280 [Actinocrinis puniceicyclus]|uniref:Uncharacterized protein n=1 Tax=Actinocrinis puniceicyclus TaxID=977794 RepID=A0A8J7WQZ9_9ACTN|nr:protein DpdD [Actinocrinis puniceicyclus]MBS2963829.1 hypothetical protein [Actinocrinis puniceicyclus]
MTDTITAGPAARWQTFLSRFYQYPNELSPNSETPRLNQFIDAAQRSISSDPPRPILLPARVAGATSYFGIAFDTNQSRTLRDLLRSHIGTTWTDFDGRSLPATTTDPLESAASVLAGDNHLIYRFNVAEETTTQVAHVLRALTSSLENNPPREARIAQPVGRLVGQFQDACVYGPESAARSAYALLAADHRITARNRLFLQTQLLASFQHWQELEDLPEYGNLLRLDQPSYVSDALARLAMSKLPDLPTQEEFKPIAVQFGSLIPSVAAIRSASGARYYTLWALDGGESVAALRRRLADAGWTPDPVIEHLTADRQTVDACPATIASPEEKREQVRRAIDSGRYDAAVDVLSTMPASTEDLPAVIESIGKTFTVKALALLERHRDVHGEQALRSAMGSTALPRFDIASSDIAQTLTGLFDGRLEPGERDQLAADVRERGVAAIRAEGGVDAAVTSIRNLAETRTAALALEPGLDTCIDLVRDLNASGGMSTQVRELSLCVLELWAYCDNSGDRHRAGRIVQLTSDLLENGLGRDAFDEVVEYLRAGWDSFHTDVDMPMNVEVLELLLAYMPSGASKLDAFARPLLTRIGDHNARRLPAAVLAVAIDIAPVFGTAIQLTERVSQELATAGTRRTTSLKIALYSLIESAADRAANLLRSRHPGLGVVVLTDTVATSALRNAAHSADLLVIMDKAATHSAVDTLRANRDARTIRYASGKGSTSLIEAAEQWLSEQ